MDEGFVKLFYWNFFRRRPENISRFVKESGYHWNRWKLDGGFSVTLDNNLEDGLSKLLGNGMEMYPSFVLASDKEAEQMVKKIVKKNGGLFSGLDNLWKVPMKQINYGIQKSDIYELFYLAGRGMRAVGF